MSDKNRYNLVQNNSRSLNMEENKMRMCGKKQNKNDTDNSETIPSNIDDDDCILCKPYKLMC